MELSVQAYRFYDCGIMHASCVQSYYFFGEIGQVFKKDLVFAISSAVFEVENP
jgi:hypothetical protein